MYASLEGLRAIVQTDRDDEMRDLFELHRARITAVIEGSRVSPTETLLAGFLNGFLTAALRLADDADAMADAIDPYLGGIYLCATGTLGRHTPVDDVDLLERLTTSLAQEPAYQDLAVVEQARAVRLVKDVFAQTPDVPVNPASLAGFALGVLYATPFISRAQGAASAALLGAATTLARRGAE